MSSFKIQWLEQPSKEAKLTATLESSGKLRISEDFLNRLPENIQFGFDESLRMMFIAPSRNGKNQYRKHKMNTIFGLTKVITDCGLKLPVCFEFSHDANSEMWIGKVLLRKFNGEYDMEQVLTLYKPIEKKLFIMMGKTTNKEERRSIIRYAICEAVNSYNPSFGDMENYIEDYTRAMLKSENSKNVKHSKLRSLDASIGDKDDKKKNRYSVVKSTDSGFSKTEDRIAEEQFRRNLSEKELTILEMSEKGSPVQAIADKLNITQEEIQILGKLIGHKRKKFFEE